MWRIIYNTQSVLDTFLKETSEIPNRPPTGAGGYITKGSVELITKKGMIEEAVRNIIREKTKDTKKNIEK